MDVEELLRDVLGGDFPFVFNIVTPVIQGLKLEKTAKILDIGTGVGWMAINLALKNYKVITGEPESDESEYAKQDWLESARKTKVDHMITYTPFNAEDMPFEDDSFNAIFIFGTLHHIDDKTATIKECYRVLKLNGIVCVFEPNKNTLKIIRDKKSPSRPDAVDPRNYVQDLSFASELITLPFYDAYILRKE